MAETEKKSKQELLIDYAVNNLGFRGIAFMVFEEEKGQGNTKVIRSRVGFGPTWTDQGDLGGKMMINNLAHMTALMNSVMAAINLIHANNATVQTHRQMSPKIILPS